MGEEREWNMLAFSLASVSVTAVLLLMVEGLVMGSDSGMGVLSEDGMRCTRCKASLSWTSENSSNGSRFERIVPENRTGS